MASMQMRRIKRHFIAVKVNKSSPYLIRAGTRAALCVTWFEGDVQIKVGQAERPNLVPNNISMLFIGDYIRQHGIVIAVIDVDDAKLMGD